MMLGIDARQPRTAPDFQTQAGKDCLATQQRGLGGCSAQPAAQIGMEARAYERKAVQLISKLFASLAWGRLHHYNVSLHVAAPFSKTWTA